MTTDRIRLPLPSADEFNLSRRGNLTLISPRKNKFAWSVEDRPYRSVILDDQGYVVSMGFEKFYNYTEPSGADNDARMLEALESGEPVQLLDKLDGSLAIRSVINGQVVFRTRGSWDGGIYGQAMRAVATAKYPVLMDPSFEPDRSLLFEFVSSRPEFRIVLSYPEDDLVLLGGVGHADLRMSDWPELESMAADNNLRLVEAMQLPRRIEDVVSAVREWEGREGVVVRCAQGQVLVKIKAAAYLVAHRVKSRLTAKTIRNMCAHHKVRSLSEFEQLLIAEGGDWELVGEARPLVDMYLDGLTEAEAQLAQVAPLVAPAWEAIVADTPDLKEARKRFATEFAAKLPAAQKHAAFSLLNGQPETALEGLMKRALDARFKAAEQSDQASLAQVEG